MTEKERILLSFILTLATLILPMMAFVFISNDRYVHVEPFFEPDVDIISPEEQIEIDPNDVFFNQSEEDLKNLVRNQEDQRPMSQTNYDQNNPSSDPYQRAKEYERQLFEEMGGDRDRKQIQEDMNQKKNKVNTNIKDNKNNSNSDSPSKSQYSGNVMVEFKLEGRSAYDNNMWFVRNPGYTCGYGASGKVVVKIKVDKGGKVIEAIYDSTRSTGADQCMIDQSVKYAKKSRFNYKEGASSQQSGFIIYRFVAQ